MSKRGRLPRAVVAVLLAALLSIAITAPAAGAARAGSASKEPSVARAAGAGSASGEPSVGSAAACHPRLAAYVAGDPLTVRGTQVLDRHQVRYVPFGISVLGLQQWGALVPRIERAVSLQIEAAVGAWHANTVRLQVAPILAQRQPGVFWPALDREVSQITCAGAIAVINDNSLFTTNEKDPTALDLGFDRELAERYGRLDDVIIDPFNEPHLGPPLVSPSRQWSVWLDGGTVDGTHYVGMQTLIDAIRAAGDPNPLWIELPGWSNNDAGLGRYPLRGANLVIEFHHPGLRNVSHFSQVMQPVDRPRVEGELSQYASLIHVECNNDAYRLLPVYLRRLMRDGDGLIAWALEPGALVRAIPHQGPASNLIQPWFPTTLAPLTHPNAIGPNYSCTRFGAGMGDWTLQLLRRYAAADDPYAPRFLDRFSSGAGSG